MELDDIYQKLSEIGQNGLAVVTVGDHATVFMNKSFEQLLGAYRDESGENDWRSIPDLRETIDGLSPGERGVVELSVKMRRRMVSLSIHVARLEAAESGLILIESQNHTRIRELEAMIDSHAKMVERNERVLKRERERADKLLLNVMPRAVVEELKEYGVAAPTRYEEASVLMLDFVAFTEMSIAEDPSAMVSELNDLFTNFDQITEQFGCERIKTIGDAYMAVSGLPEPNPDHAAAIAKTAQLFIRYLQHRNRAHKVQWTARIGLASGPLIGSIVGVQKYVYDVFGPAVNLASRMERRCGPMEIVLCSPMSEMLTDQFPIEPRGREEIKGFGMTDLFTLGHTDRD